MNTFIDHIIQHSVGKIKHTTDLQNHVYVFPTRRAGKFFEKALAKYAKHKYMFVPQIFSISDFFRHVYENFVAPDSIIIPPAKAVFELFLCYKNHEPEVNFDSFYTWGQLVLKDFDEIDKYLADTDKLFASIKDIKTLDEEFAVPQEQLSFIKEFWRVLEKENNTDMEKEFIRIWEILGNVYPEFKETLIKKQYAYEGMAQKIIVEQLLNGTLQLPFEHIVWAGFSSLSTTERLFIEYITQDSQNGYVYWDTDSYYMNDERQEAGYFLRQYYKMWKNHDRHNWDAQTDLTQARKQIRVVGVPLKVGQAKYTGQVLEQIVDHKTLDIVETTIVLGDENLLFPILYALPSNVEKLNITMGYPLKNTPLFQLLEQIVQLHKIAVKNDPKDPDARPLYYAKTVLHILNNPFIKSLEKDKVEQSINYITRNNKIRLYPESVYARFLKTTVTDTQKEAYIKQIQQQKVEELPFELYEAFIHPIFAVLFKDISQPKIYPTPSVGIIEVFEKILQLLYQHFTAEILQKIDANIKIDEENYNFADDESDEQNSDTTDQDGDTETQVSEPTIAEVSLPIEAELIYNMLKHLHIIESTLKDYRQIVTLDTFWKLFKQVLQEQRLDFIGEPVRGLQLMGFLETRVLDFKNIILLAVNEGVIPASKSNATFIPFNLRRAFNMPTNSDHDAAAAYNFYHLLQRSQNIYLLYNTEINVMGDQEKSRFILQIENELLPQNPNISYLSKIVMPPLKNNPKVVTTGKIVIPKTPDIIDILSQYQVSDTTEPDEDTNNKRIFPTALLTYINCPVEFYWRYVAQLKDVGNIDDLVEDIDNRLFGNILHRTIELLYKPFNQYPITAAFIQKLLDNPKLINRCLNKAFEDNLFEIPKEGKNALIKRVLKRLVQKVLENDINDAPFQIVGLETHEYTTDFTLSNGTVIGLKGTIDRIDSIEIPDVGTCYRVLDYKTGEVEIIKAQNVSKDDLDAYFERYFNDPKYKAGFQIYLYAYLFWKNNDQIPLVKAGLYTLKKISQGILFVKDGEILTKDDFEAFENQLRRLLDELFDPETPFIQTEHIEERYKYSPFTGLY
jgi:RecB family exonuclease